MLGNGGGRHQITMFLLWLAQWDPDFQSAPLEINTRKIKARQMLSFHFKKKSSATLIYLHHVRKRV